MVKIHVDRQQGVERVQMRGSLDDVCGELGYALFVLYRNLCRENREAAEQFRELMRVVLGDDSPTWDESLECHVAERCAVEKSGENDAVDSIK